MKNSRIKRIMAFLLCLVLLVCSSNSSAFIGSLKAAGTEENEGVLEEMLEEVTDSMEEVLEETNVPDQIGSWDLSIEERFQLIINAYKQLRDDYERGIKISEGEGDDSTNDLLISYHTAIEKRIWMMSAELGQRPGEGE